MTAQAASVDPAPASLSGAERARILLFGGVLLLLLNFATPYGGLIGIPISFFLKNKLHLQAHQLAAFNLWVGIPLYLSFVFGFLRDRWSPFRGGDRAHLVVFAAATAATYVAMAFLTPTYAMLLVGLLIATCAVQIVASAANGLVSTIGQQHIMAGQVSTVFNLATWIPVTAATVLGGVFSDALESRNSGVAARLLFLAGAALAGAIAVFGARGPRFLFAAARSERSATASLGSDVWRLLGHWPIYAPLILLLLWNFSPGGGIALQYHLANSLKATDTQVGAYFAISYGAALPPYALYGWLCRKVRLSKLLFWGTVMAIPQMIPLLLIHSPTGALIAAVPMGLCGGIASAAYVDLAIRSCPRGLQGTMIMLVATVFWVAGRFGDVWGAELYDHEGGFVTAVIATTAVYALMLPVLLLAPRRLTATADGQILEEATGSAGHFLPTPIAVTAAGDNPTHAEISP
jgi:MFS family permease